MASSDEARRRVLELLEEKWFSNDTSSRPPDGTRVKDTLVSLSTPTQYPARHPSFSSLRRHGRRRDSDAYTPRMDVSPSMEEERMEEERSDGGWSTDASTRMDNTDVSMDAAPLSTTHPKDVHRIVGAIVSSTCAVLYRMKFVIEVCVDCWSLLQSMVSS